MSAQMSGGEEVNGVVIDLGSQTCKVGYAGEDTPKFVFPSQVGVLAPDEQAMDDGTLRR
jgi:actin-related protein